jgi:hypothetical protein
MHALTLAPEDFTTPLTMRPWRSVYSENAADLLVDLQAAIAQEGRYNLQHCMIDLARYTHFRWHQSLELGAQVLVDFHEAVLHGEWQVEPYLDRLAACAVRPYDDEELVISMQQYRLLTPHTVELLLDVVDLRVVA